MTHEDTEAAIAKAELEFFRLRPSLHPDTIGRSAIVDGAVVVYGKARRPLARYRIIATRFSIKVEEIKP